MRITGGLWGGRTLIAPRGDGTRPTTDGNRQALFNILEHSLDHQPQQVLDLFAGSGALGLEALSHGAQSVVFVENDPRALKVIRKNCESLGVAPDSFEFITETRIESWPELLMKRVERHGPFDTVFLDPPYERRMVDRCMKALLKHPELFHPESCVIYVETAIRETTPVIAGWACVQKREKSSSAQSFFTRQG